MIFDDVVKLIPKSCLAEEHNAHINAISCAFYEALDTANYLSACEMSIANFTEPANHKKAMVAPDSHYWKGACDTEMNTLNKMQCWDIVDASTMPKDAELLTTKWILKLKFENGK